MDKFLNLTTAQCHMKREEIFSEWDKLNKKNYVFSRISVDGKIKRYSLEFDNSKMVVPAQKITKRKIFEKKVPTEDHKMEIIANILLKDLTNPEPATLRYIREEKMSRDEINLYKLPRKIPRGKSTYGDIYFGADPLIKWKNLIMGVDFINGKPIYELPEADIPETFYKIGYFCGCLRNRHFNYRDFQTDHFMAKRRKGKLQLFVVDLGEVRFVTEFDQKQKDEFFIVKSPAFKRFLSGQCAGKEKLKAREFVTGYQDARKGY